MRLRRQPTIQMHPPATKIRVKWLVPMKKRNLSEKGSSRSEEKFTKPRWTQSRRGGIMKKGWVNLFDLFVCNIKNTHENCLVIKNYIERSHGKVDLWRRGWVNLFDVFIWKIKNTHENCLMIIIVIIIFIHFGTIMGIIIIW